LNLTLTRSQRRSESFKVTSNDPPNLTPRNALALSEYAELAGMTPEQFLYVSVGFKALKKSANALSDLI